MKEPIDASSQRVADQAWRFYMGETLPVMQWLVALGCEIPISRGTGDHCEYTVQGLTGIRVGLMYPTSDPVTVGVQFGFLVGGQMWPHAFPGLLDAISVKWKAGRQEHLAREAALGLRGSPKGHRATSSRR